MSNEKIKIEAHLAGSELVLGNKVIELSDKTDTTFNTKSIDEFVKYVSNLGCPDLEIFYDESSIVAINPTEVGFFKSSAIANCQLYISPALATIINHIGKELTLKQLVDLLTRLKTFLDPKSLKLLDQLNDLSIKKVVSIERSQDKKGNFNYQVASKSAGKSDYNFEDPAIFKLPLFQHDESTVELPFDVLFDYLVGSEGGVMLSFMLENFLLNDIIDKAKSDSIVKKLADLNLNCYSGTLQVNKKLDRERFMMNTVNL